MNIKKSKLFALLFFTLIISGCKNDSQPQNVIQKVVKKPVLNLA